MGQLERYGLYVLCVVIFLILGVALWGGDPAMAPGNETLTSSASRDLRSGAPANDPTPPASPALKGKPDDDVVAKLQAAFRRSSESDAPKTNDKSVEPLAGVTTSPPTDNGKEPARQAPSAATEYVVKKGDNLESIALVHFGKRTAWPEIVKANPGLTPTNLPTGGRIKLPPKSVLDTPVAAPLQTDEYVIKRDDILEDIALAKLGKKTLWRAIVDANPGLNPNNLKPGTRIKIPAAPTTAKASSSR